jgi:hypothetical protein
LGRAAVPAALVPKKQPWIRTPVAAAPRTWMPSLPKRLMTNPRTTLLAPSISSPTSESESLLPSSSIRSTALVPTAAVFGVLPGWV